MMAYGIEMAVQIEPGASAEIEPAAREPLDAKIQGGLMIDSIHEDTREALLRRLEDGFIQLRDSDKKEFGICIAYGVDMPPEAEDYITEQLVDACGAKGVGIKRENPTDGLEFIWGARLGSAIASLRRYKAAIVFDNGDMLPEATIFSLNALRD